MKSVDTTLHLFQKKLKTLKGMSEESQISNELTMVETEIIGYIVNVATVFRFPKSVGEIFGLLYVKPEPQSMDCVMRTLGISLGSASQGIKTLRLFGAVRSVYVPGSRKEFFTAETDFRNLIKRLVLDEWKPKLDAANERLDQIENQLLHCDVESHLRDKVQILKRLNYKANLVFAPLSKIIQSRSL
jgi:HTH-type transcriptional regulator, glycine betaine synthesis regulator